MKQIKKKKSKNTSSIPSVITQWKNKKGFMISLERRLASLQDEEIEVNIEKFKKFNEKLEELDEKYK